MPQLKKILYVEDDESIAEVVMMTLEDFGDFQVQHCPSGQEAVDAFSVFKPDLVLLDVMMPGMDGPTALQHIRKLPGGSSIPVIFMTAKAQVHQQQEYLDLGALGVIVKPFDPTTLCDQLRQLYA